MKKALAILVLPLALLGCTNKAKEEISQGSSENSTVNSTSSTSSTNSSEKEFSFNINGSSPKYLDGQIELTGNAEPDTTVIVFLENKNEKITETTADNKGSYSVRFSAPSDKENFLFQNNDNKIYITLYSEELFPKRHELEEKEKSDKIKAEKEKQEKAKREEKEKQEKEAREKEAREKEEEEKRKQEEIAQYETGITFENLARNPETYNYKKVKFYGKIVQVVKGDAYSQFRFAIDDDYDKMVLLEIPEKQLSNNRLLKDDTITIKGVSTGEQTYKSTIGGEITIPSISVDSFELQ